MTIELSDERIDAMRAHVLDGVNDDLARRGRRVRKTIAGGVCALALVTVIGIATPSLTSGGGQADYQAASPRDAVTRMSKSATAPEAAGADDAAGSVSSLRAEATDSYAAKDIAPVPPGNDPLTAPGKDREVITTGSATVTVKDTADSANRFTAWTEKHGGRVDGRTESRERDGHTSATLVVRVPSKWVSAAIKELRGLGTVENVDLQRDDVTAEGQDLDARIKALKISVTRLEGILQRAGSSSEVIEAEGALSSRQQELDALQVQRRSLSDQVALSSIDVSFIQESKPGAVTPGGFKGGLIKGWNSLVDTVNSVVTAAGVLVPWLVIGGGLGLAWWIVRRVRHRQ